MMDIKKDQQMEEDTFCPSSSTETFLEEYINEGAMRMPEQRHDALQTREEVERKWQCCKDTVAVRLLLGLLEAAVLVGLAACFNVLWWLLSGCASKGCFSAFHIFTILMLEALLMIVLALVHKCKNKRSRQQENDYDQDNSGARDDEIPQQEEDEHSIQCNKKEEGPEESSSGGWCSSTISRLRDFFAYLKFLRPNTWQWVAVVVLALIGSQIVLIFWLPTAVIVSDAHGNLPGGSSISCWEPNSQTLLHHNQNNNISQSAQSYNPHQSWHNNNNDDGEEESEWYDNCNFTNAMLWAQEIYGDCIDFTKIKIVYGGMPRYFGRMNGRNGYAMCIDNTMFFTYCPSRNLLLHELAHAWQFQNNVYYYGRQGPANFLGWLHGQFGGDIRAFYRYEEAMQSGYYGSKNKLPYQDVFNAENMASLIADGILEKWTGFELSEPHQYYLNQMLGDCLPE
uniref:Uncharacterized protein n=1 Tax=Pseudictyota dubia TaxID=2749911 RepID=A0A7R9ZF13_9STRA